MSFHPMALAILCQVLSAALPPPTMPELAAELNVARAEDQAAGERFSTGGPELVAVNRRHTERLKEIIAAYGWPTIPLVGPRASRGAWLIAQHADHDLPLQLRALSLMEEAARAPGLVFAQDVAYLADRVRINSGRPQLYGTQLEVKGGKRVPKTIESPESVDQRRLSVGLPPLAEYLAGVNDPSK
jgi:hypothetical protein